jgi:hypothetical protein
MLAQDSDNTCWKIFKEIRGFLVYVTRTYIGMLPYLLGLHMTIDMWRSGQDSEGWRTNEEVILSYGEEGELMDPGRDDVQASFVKAVSQLEENIEALEYLCQADVPPLRRVHCAKHACAYYGFGDASGCGFDATMQVGNVIGYEYGQWVWEAQESSNWQEVKKLVEFAKGKVLSKDLSGCQLFIFTDNTTTKAVFWKGSSKSRKIFELMLRSDDLPRADHLEGVVQGHLMLEFMPLHQDPTHSF